jgi:exoribonuclease R
MTTYKILINDKNYESWNFMDPITSNNIESEQLNTINPLDNKMFTRDYFKIVDNKVIITNSVLRNQCDIPGLLILENNKSYGRNGRRLLYKCIPDDVRLPVFLIPYEIKMGFDKNFKNKYVVFRYDDWTNDKHPYGKLTCAIGNVDILEHFYEYQLYCKSLHISINDFTSKVKKTLSQQTFDDYINSIKENKLLNMNKNTDYIFSIDPKSSGDYDDALSININNNITTVKVYITNVFACLETLELWNSFSKRVSTIYLPDRRRPMLPTILCETLCSLQAKQERPVIVYTFVYNETELIDFNITNEVIKISKNFTYDDKKIEQNKHYCLLYNFTSSFGDIRGTYDIVSHWMVMVNKYSSYEFLKHKNGIFRSLYYINKDEPDIDDSKLSKSSQRVIRNWNNISGQYVYYSETANISHELMDEKSYVHVTSPMRRLVDLLNQIETMENMGIVVSQQATDFKNKWLSEMEYINQSMRSIRKVQSECELLCKCFNDPYMYDEIYDGIIFDKIMKTDGSFSYMVLLDKINVITRYVTQNNYNIRSEFKFKLYLFEDENKLKQKIKIKLIN